MSFRPCRPASWFAVFFAAAVFTAAGRTADAAPTEPAADAFARVDAGFAGYFESATLSRLLLGEDGPLVRGRIDQDPSGEWRLEAKPAADGRSLAGSASDGRRRVDWTAGWRGDSLLVRLDGRETLYHRTAPLAPKLVQLGEWRTKPVARWTLAIYLGGDNNLEAAALADLAEMRAALPREGVEVIVLLDRAQGYATEEGDWTGAKVLRIRPDGQPDTVLADLGEIDTGDATTLASFLVGAFRAYPAEHYGAVIWNHGGGWTGVVTDEEVPGHPGKTNMLNLVDLRVALRAATIHATRRPLDLLAFDACNMAQLEVALQLSDLARYMTASEAIVPGTGYPYQRILPLLADPAHDPRAVAIGIADAFAASYRDAKDETTTVAAFDLAAMPAVARALSDFAFVGEVFKEGYWSAVQRALFYAESYGARSERLRPATLPSIDIRDLVHRIAQGMEPLPLGKWVRAVDDALDRAVLATRNGDLRHRSGGLALFGPRTAAQVPPGYAITPLARRNDWTKLLRSAHAEAAKHAADPLEFSDVQLISTVVDGRNIVRPFDADSVAFTLKGHSIVEIVQIDQQRDGPGWAVLRKRWVPDPMWMKRVQEGGTEITDLFMPRFVDGENRLQVELTGQRFLASDGETTVNLTLDASSPDHGAALTSLAKFYPAGADKPALVEVEFDPVWWIVVRVNLLSGNPLIASRPIQPREGDRLAFLLETVADDGTADSVETPALTWRGRGPALLFSRDEPGDYRSIFVARTLDGREYFLSLDYPVEANPELESWIASWKDVDWSRLRGTWSRHVLLPDGGTLDTHTTCTLGAPIQPGATAFEVSSVTRLDGRDEQIGQFWFFQPGPVPSLRIIHPIAGSPDLCWYGPARLGQDGQRPWLALKALQVGGVTWRWDLSLFDSLRVR